ncbi:ATP-grasp domain-containing protein [Rhizobium ruizarguesonis]|uniref:ATP-grasp domain-containing protein n=1 Tax=Rhizobium ruizarguesonis TaxID=2081791 RepID=UPI0013C284C3|nr:ATP-grasp domain-containing protein [Rhizobium ruizarguesonis]NEJ02594.1 ATP-grasp domain-containing protein [Rhizobium ruizarguesonis]NEJ39722.1 ATP-grasp domain-containing protein [Rhizobium ruizarguesonis]
MTDFDVMAKADLVLFIGNARPPEYQYFKDNSILTGLLHDSHCPIAYPPEGEFAEVITVDSNAGAARSAFDHLQEKYTIVAQVAAVETAVYDNALLAIHTGLPAPSLDAAEIALNKPMMRKLFISQLGDDSTSASTIVSNENDIGTFAEKHGYPIILKPTNLFGSMFVTKSYSLAELLENYWWMSGEIRAHLDANGRSDEQVEIQAETYLDGSSHSVDCVVDGSGTPYPSEIVDVLTERDFGDDRVQHFARYAPSALNLEQQVSCKEFAAAAVRALGLRYCVAHVEFILTSKGPRLLEIAGRPGGNRVHLMRQVFGIDIMGAYFAALTDQPINIKPLQVKPRAIISVYPAKSGLFAGIRNVDTIQGLPGYVKHGVRVQKGEPIGPASDGHLPVLSIEISRDTVTELSDAIKAARVVCSLVDIAPE